MTPLSFEIRGEVKPFFRYLWAKNVRGFNSTVHCARCLIGEYSEAFGRSAPVNVRVEDPLFRPGDVAYFCGVSNPYVWSNNLHLAGVVTEGAVSRVSMWQGGEIVVYGLEEIPFDNQVARRLYTERTRNFLTCRNFQFGAHYFKGP